MRREDVEKLLGGYAAGTLTADERRALFEAALSDQALFAALADEEPLRDALADPEARAQVSAALRDEAPSLWERWTAGLGMHRGWTFAAVSAATAVAVGAIVIGTGLLHRPVAEKQEIALLRTPPPPAEVAPQAPAAVEERKEERAPRANAVPVPRRFEPPAASLKKQKADLAESPPVLSDAAQAPVAGAVGGVVGAAPPPPPAVFAALPAPAAETAQAQAKPKAHLVATSAMSAGARALFYQAQGGSAGDMSRDNLVAQEQDRTERAEKRVRALNAPTRPVGDLGMRYSLVRRGPDGAEGAVPLDTVLERGMASRLRIEVNEAAHLSVTADRSVLFAGPVAPGVPTFVDARPGKIRMVLSRQSFSGGASGLVGGASDARADQPVLTETADGAVYVVNTSGAVNPRVLAEVELKYR